VGYTSTPIWEDGRLVGAVVTFQDITERKRAEVMQHKQQSEYQTIFNSVPAMIWYVDKDNTVLRANQLAVHTTGLGLEEIQGQSAYDLYPDEAAQYHKDTLDVISSGKPKEGIIEPYQVASGEKRWVRTDKIPYRDDQGNIVGVIVFAVDITAEKQAQLLVQEERKVLEMIATGHSLPTILGTITAQMETLLPHSLCSILLLDETGTRLVHGVAPSLPEEYIQAINGIEVGPGVGSCGTAAYLGETVIVADIEEDPLWANFRQLAKVHGLRTCWSFPIKSSQGAVLGTYALYYTNPKHPTQHELALVDSAAHLAAIGIERRRGEEAISRLNQELEQRVVERTHQLEIKVRESREAQARSQSLAKFPAENPNPVLRLSREGRILYANKASKPLLAIWRCEEGQTLPEPWHQLTLEGFRTNLLQQGEVQAPNRVYSLTFAPIEHANYMNIYGLDITARKQAEEAMLKGERKFRAIYEQAPTGIAIVDSLSGQFTQINQKYCDITGYSAEEMLERTFQELTHPDDLQADLAQMQQLLADQISSFQIEKRYIRKDGAVIWVNLTCVPLWLEPTDPRQHMAMVEDITERKQGEIALKASEERLDMALDATSEGVWDWDLTSDRVFFSPRWLESLGFAPDELEPHVDSWKSLVHPDDVPRMMETLKAHLEGRTPVYECENRLLTKSGRWRWNLDRGKVVARDQNGRALRMVGVDVDISKRRQAEEALRDKTTQLQVITEAMTAYLERGNWREASLRLIQGALGQTESEYGFVGVVLDGPVLRILAYEGIVWDEKINRSFYEEAVRNFEAKGYLEFTEMNNLFGHVITSGAVVLSNSPASDPRAGGRLLKGHPPLKSFLGVPILRENEVVGMIGVANRQNGYTGIEQDKIQILTRAASVLYENYSQRQREATLEMARQQAEEQIRTALNEKEVLLKEIHHRVKNNLQVVSSLLSLQASKLVDDQQREPFQVSQDRLQAMLLIHEQLYRSENLREISFGEFIERQAHELWRAYGVDSERVILDIRADGVRLEIDKAIPCGLIVTELLTNALKYAFPSEKAGKIIIQLLAAQDARVALTISDNGVGLPDSFDIRHVNSLGMRLVCALTDQLEGSIKLTREGGTEFMIQFPQ
jgi:PAS domain S-box-containing protein